MASPPNPPAPRDAPIDRSIPRVGRLSEFLGSRLLLIGLLAGFLGFALLLFAGIKLYLVLTGGSLSSDGVPILVAGILAFCLLSIGGSSTRTGLKYLRGERALARDVARFIARRRSRRR
jgi:hypothetical protein